VLNRACFLKATKAFFDYNDHEPRDIVECQKETFLAYIKQINKLFSVDVCANSALLEVMTFNDNTLKFSINHLFDHLAENTNKQQDVVTVYRLERDNTGIYRCEDVYHEVIFDISKFKGRQPDAQTDGDISLIFAYTGNNAMGIYHQKWYFAFSSLNQIEDWFPEKTLIDIAHYGIEIVRYDVPKIHTVTSAQQCCFLKHKSTRRHSIPLSTHLDITVPIYTPIPQGTLTHLYK
jgi:hypothetical protein